MLQKIISGGQTGADSAALNVAIEFNIPPVRDNFSTYAVQKIDTETKRKTFLLPSVPLSLCGKEKNVNGGWNVLKTKQKLRYSYLSRSVRCEDIHLASSLP